MRVPDLIEPFVAWRVWGVCLGASPDLYGALQLDSLYHNARWPFDGPLVATCGALNACEVPSPADRADRHHGGQGCGIYAAKDLSRAAAYLPDWVTSRNAMVQKRCTLVVGRCEMFGVVREHEDGYRAQKARPFDVYVPTCFGAFGYDARRAASALQENYGIPTRLFRRIRELEDI